MWAVVACRPECLYAMSVLSRYLVNPGLKHWRAANYLLRYMLGTAERGTVLFSPFSDRKKPVILSGRCDSSHADDADSRKSTIGWVWIVNGAVSASAKRATHRTLSAQGAEMTAASECFREGTWLRGFLQDLGEVQIGPTYVFTDNSGAVAASSQLLAQTRCDEWLVWR